VLPLPRCTARLCAARARAIHSYAMVACRAFGFCLTYKRNTEFRRLCDILRQHLANINKCVVSVCV
jgi:translation initiation factor 3 subunit A